MGAAETGQLAVGGVATAVAEELAELVVAAMMAEPVALLYLVRGVEGIGVLAEWVPVGVGRN